jgi:hypothetical protein
MENDQWLGREFKNLKVEYFSREEIKTCSTGRTMYKRYYMCSCKCGSTKEVAINNLAYGHTKSCGCLKHRRAKDNPGWTGYEGISGYYWNKLKHNATKRKSRKLPFKITIEYAWALFLEQDKCCALTGLPIDTSQSSKNKEWSSTASLDRIDSSQGYIPGNVQWVHKDVNQMKWTLSQDRFINVCKLVVNKHDKR